MGVINGKDKICSDICDALGLKHVKSLDIHMASDKIVTITAVYYPDIDGVPDFPVILKQYELIEKK